MPKQKSVDYDMILLEYLSFQTWLIAIIRQMNSKKILVLKNKHEFIKKFGVNIKTQKLIKTFTQKALKN